MNDMCEGFIPKRIFEAAIVLSVILGLLIAAYNIGYIDGLEKGRLSTVNLLNNLFSCANLSLITQNDVNNTCVSEWYDSQWNPYRELMRL
jgi:hypothetical protein